MCGSHWVVREAEWFAAKIICGSVSERRPRLSLGGLRWAMAGVAGLVGALSLGAPGAEAKIAATTGDVQVIPPPPSVVWGALEDNNFTRLFAERQSVALKSAIEVDISGPILTDGGTDLSPAKIPEHTVVDSYLLHSDVVGYDPIERYRGTVTFDAPVLGVIVTSEKLYPTDHILGSPTTAYLPPNPFRGFELSGLRFGDGPVSDKLRISADLRTVTFEFRTGEMLDEARIITRASRLNGEVAEPETIWLSTVAALGFAAIRGRRRDAGNRTVPWPLP
jgi:hypothetical protein